MVKLLTDRKFMPSKIDDSNIISFLRTNALYKDKVLSAFYSSNQDFYIHYMDGDHWSQVDYWIERKEFATDVIKKFFEISTYKDCIFMYADEFVIIDFIDHTEEINECNIVNKEKVTAIVYKCNGEYNQHIIKELSKKMPEMKRIKRGEVYGCRII